MPEPVDVVGLFLDGGHVVAEAIADPAVAAAWDRPSVLEDQLVSGLAGHVARGVWAVGEYLESGPAQGPVAFGSAGEYFTAFVRTLQPTTTGPSATAAPPWPPSDGTSWYAGLRPGSVFSVPGCDPWRSTTSSPCSPARSCASRTT